MAPFTKQMSILEALETHPAARQVFERYGMGCSLCIGAQLESIESGAIMHAVDADDVVAELNGLDHRAATE
jgi:hybrid cluster-associated redox disulfide protein